MNIKLFPLLMILTSTFLTGIGVGGLAEKHRTTKVPEQQQRYVAYWHQCYDEKTGGVQATDYCLEVGEALGIVGVK